MGDFFYGVTHHLTLFLPALGSRCFRDGLENVPKTGPALLLCNHTSHFDPPLIAEGFPRAIHFMADKPLLDIPIYGWLLKKGHVFPIDRTKSDRSAVKTTIQRLEAGHVVGIFPEGGIRHGATAVLGGAELPMGTISLWRMANVPVIPVVIIGGDQMYDWKNIFRRPRKRVFVRYGPMLPPDKLASREQLRERVVTAWRDLFTGMQTDYHIRPEELPQSAQRRLGLPEPVKPAAPAEN